MHPTIGYSFYSCILTLENSLYIVCSVFLLDFTLKNKAHLTHTHRIQAKTVVWPQPETKQSSKKKSRCYFPEQAAATTSAAPRPEPSSAGANDTFPNRFSRSSSKHCKVWKLCESEIDRQRDRDRENARFPGCA